MKQQPPKTIYVARSGCQDHNERPVHVSTELPKEREMFDSEIVYLNFVCFDVLLLDLYGIPIYRIGGRECNNTPLAARPKKCSPSNDVRAYSWQWRLQAEYRCSFLTAPAFRRGLPLVRVPPIERHS